METSVLRNGPLRALLAAEVISTTGMQMTWLALPWFVLVTTDSPARMTGVMAAELLGFAVAGLPTGPLIQRLGARRTMLAADALRTPLMLLVPVLHWSGHLVYGELVLLALLLGVVGAPYFTAQRVMLPELLGEDEVTMSKANALFQGAIRTTLFLGPPLAGVLIGVLDAASVLVIDAGTYVVSFLLVALFVPGRDATPEAEEARGILAGLRFLRREPLLRIWIPLFVIGDAGWQAFFAAVPVLTVERFGADAKIAGILFAAFGGGALVGNFASYRFLAARVEGLRLIGLSVPFQALPLWILPLDVGAAAMFAAVLASGVANGVCNPSIHAIWTLRMPVAIRPKAMAASGTIWGLGMPVGLLVAGPILSLFGAQPVLVGFAAVQTVCMFAVAAVSLKAASPALPETAETPG
jgi:predicted MFS family arabinose efflux permease